LKNLVDNLGSTVGALKRHPGDQPTVAPDVEEPTIDPVPPVQEVDDSQASEGEDYSKYTLHELEQQLAALKTWVDAGMDKRLVRQALQVHGALVAEIEKRKRAQGPRLSQDEGRRRKVSPMDPLQLSQHIRENRLLEHRIDEILLSAKNVSPADKKKLRGLLRHYAKKKHPFTACVRDNRKRFGPGTEAVCATLKDVIRGTTKWRGKGNKRDKGVAHGILSDEELCTMLLSIPDNEASLILEYGAPEASTGGDGMPPDANWQMALPEGPNCGTCLHYSDEGSFCELYQAPTDASHVSDGYEMDPEYRGMSAPELAASAMLSDVTHGEYLGEFADTLALEGEESDRGVWKTILTTGTWKTRPGPNGTVIDKPLHVKLAGKVRKGHIALEDLVAAFKDGAVEHVTVPLSHKDNVHENTGYVRDLRIEPDNAREGHHKLLAKIHFTDPEIEQKALNGSIANTSVGVNFDYIRKRDGRKYGQVLGHVALTNKPWIDGMEPFGQLAASEQHEGSALYASFDNDNAAQEVTNVGNEGEGTTLTLSEQLEQEFGMTAEELREQLKRSEEQNERLRLSEVKSQKQEWKAAGVPPAVIEVAESILLADDGGAALLLSEEGTESTLTVSEVVRRIVEKVPTLVLSESITDEDKSKDKPADNADSENLPHNVKVRAAELALADISLSEDDAIKQAKNELGLSE
jgi:hypothetical protein